MVKVLFFIFLSCFGLYFSQVKHLQYDFTTSDPMSKESYHQIANLWTANDRSLYEVSPIDNMIEGTKEAHDGSVVVVKNDDFKYQLYNNGKILKIKDQLQDEVYYLQEELPVVNWIKVNKTKTSNGIVLKMAKTTFRGRDYIAWYDDDVKAFSGPWKLNGLGRVIVEMHSIDGKASWKLKSKNVVKDNIADPFTSIKENFRPYTDYPELAYGLSPRLKAALSKNPNNKIVEQPRTDLETKFEWEK